MLLFPQAPVERDMPMLSPIANINSFGNEKVVKEIPNNGHKRDLAGKEDYAKKVCDVFFYLYYIYLLLISSTFSCIQVDAYIVLCRQILIHAQGSTCHCST